jgi:hypothetical protein
MSTTQLNIESRIKVHSEFSKLGNGSKQSGDALRSDGIG